jgi:hypothetical protein
MLYLPILPFAVRLASSLALMEQTAKPTTTVPSWKAGYCRSDETVVFQNPDSV